MMAKSIYVLNSMDVNVVAGGRGYNINTDAYDDDFETTPLSDGRKKARHPICAEGLVRKCRIVGVYPNKMVCDTVYKQRCTSDMTKATKTAVLR